eukprot:gnl/TRDRNA2_/TRDRNA2_30192_c0_seq1.p1 gnl/TRDRNA2_/TRDRNA2_30192_c0~~gnl/TRDRNA2_/TRDRNA2_30192_c0_seq1.p1  ORF type:complete len:392 (+),score=51.68 gnl/TRDRNA2_/TRDRNA2_30192_c0_seq1:28-1203(+)
MEEVKLMKSMRAIAVNLLVFVAEAQIQGYPAHRSSLQRFGVRRFPARPPKLQGHSDPSLRSGPREVLSWAELTRDPRQDPDDPPWDPNEFVFDLGDDPENYESEIEYLKDMYYNREKYPPTKEYDYTVNVFGLPAEKCDAPYIFEVDEMCLFLSINPRICISMEPRGSDWRSAYKSNAEENRKCLSIWNMAIDNKQTRLDYDEIDIVPKCYSIPSAVLDGWYTKETLSRTDQRSSMMAKHERADRRELFWTAIQKICNDCQKQTKGEYLEVIKGKCDTLHELWLPRQEDEMPPVPPEVTIEDKRNLPESAFKRTEWRPVPEWGEYGDIPPDIPEEFRKYDAALPPLSAFQCVVASLCAISFLVSALFGLKKKFRSFEEPTVNAMQEDLLRS